jgi:ketosteroid isomerase-like protein
VDALGVARAYDRAYDARDVERMVALAHEDVEAITPRGTARGHAPLRVFMARQTYGVSWHATERRYFYRGGNTVVVSVQGEWRYVDSGDVAERENGAAVYTVHDGLIARFQPFEDLDAALATAAMTQDDEATG